MKQSKHQFSKHLILNVAEKPSVAKSIANILSSDISHEHTHSIYNKVYKFQYNLMNEDVEMLFTSVTGHLNQLKYDDKYKDWQAWDPQIILKSAEIYSYVPQDKSTRLCHLDNLLQNLTYLSKKCQTLILWLDCDREGENIAFEVADVCKQVNPQLNILRARFSAVTIQDIQNALNQLRPPDENLSNSVKARQEIDLRIGASFTRFQTLLLRRYYSLKSVVSYGPCQFPTLGFVVQRYKEIQEFGKEKFWYISCKVNDVEFNWSRGNIFDEMIVLILFERCFTQQGQIIDIHGKEVQKWKPLPLSTIEFEKLASKKLKISAHKAMEIAEKLYNQGFISYPRTETNKFPNTMNLKNLLQLQQNHPQWGQYAKSLIDYNYDHPRGGNKDDKAHPPIHPVKLMTRENTQNQEEFQIYELITRHFLACCSKNAIGQETQIQMKVKTEEFKKVGLVIKEKNFLEIYPYEQWAQQYVPEFTKGELLNVILSVKNGVTAPPQPMSEAELIGLMDKNGIGTDATIHEHIKTIQDREYANKFGQIIKPTKLGIALVESYAQLGFTLHQPNLRATMEERMNLVAQGLQNKDLMVSDTINEMEIILKEMQLKQMDFLKTVGFHLEILANQVEEGQLVSEEQFGKCGVCQNHMNYQDFGQKQQLICQTCNFIYKLPYEGKPIQLLEQCTQCQFQIVEIKRDNGSSYKICPKCYNDQRQFSNQDFNRSQGEPFSCNLCQRKMKLRMSKSTSNVFFGCSGFPSCKQSVFIPKFMTKIQITDSLCNKCSSHLFTVQFNEAEYLLSNLQQRKLDPNSLYCLYPNCDKDYLIRWSNNNENSQPTQYQMKSSTSSNNNNLYQNNNNNNNHNQNHNDNDNFNNHSNFNNNNKYNKNNNTVSPDINTNTNNTSTNITYSHNNNNISTNQNKLQGITCYFCKQQGHYADSCPQKQQKEPQNKQEKKCKECGVVGRHPKNTKCLLKQKKGKKNHTK